MTWKAYAAVSGATLLATYLFSAPAGVVTDRTATARPNLVSSPQAPVFDIQEQAQRLESRAVPVTDYHQPSRNPFRFGSRPESHAPRVARQPPALPPPPVAVAPPAPVVPQPPPIRLSGIATETVGGTRQRSAILVTPAGVVRVREGDQVGAEYRVTKIEEDAVELAMTDGTTRRLPLRP